MTKQVEKVDKDRLNQIQLEEKPYIERETTKTFEVLEIV